MGYNPDYRHVTGGGAAAPSSNVFETTKGQTLGGKKLAKGRLVDGNSGSSGGHRLGGSRVSNPNAIRKAIVKAAEARKRQMEATRRMMEKAKQPCVIEIYDSDDEEEDEPSNQYAKIPARSNRRRDQDQKQQDSTAKRPKVECIDLTSPDTKPKTPLETKKPIAVDNECIDLTSDVEDDSIKATVPVNARTLPCTTYNDGWICTKCTLQNRPLVLVCDACLQERFG